MKILYLHIGTAKTATSSIQKYCATNQEILLKYSYCYPDFPFEYPDVTIYRNGHFLAFPVRKKNPSEKKIKTWENNLATGLDIIHKCFEQSDNVVLSEETLWLAILYSRYNPLKILKEDAVANDYNVKVIVYLRRQDAYLVSRWNQLVKRKNLNQTFNEHINYIKKERPLLIQYAEGLDVISDIIGHENIIVRRFVPETWIGNSIYTDFMDAIGMDKNAVLTLPERESNPSLKLNAAEIKRELNTISFLSDKDKKYFGQYLRQINPEFPDSDLYNLLSTDEASKLLEECRDGNNRVAKEYLKIDTPLFSEEIKDAQKWESDNEFMTEDIIKFFSVILVDQKNKIKDLKQENKQLKKEIKKINSELNSLRADYLAFKDKLRHPFRTIFKRIFL